MSLKRPKLPTVIFYLASCLLLVVIVGAWFKTSSGLVAAGGAETMLALGRLSALTGVYLILWQMLLVSRAPWLEAVHGFDVRTRIHRWNGLLAFALVSLHIPLVIGSYSLRSGLTPPDQVGVFWTQYQYVWLAFAAYALLVITIGLSATIVRRHLRYETWYFVHLLNYAVLVIAIWHQVSHGATLLEQDWLRVLWYGLHVAVIAQLMFYRFALPPILYWKHRFYVEKVVKETENTYSVYVKGRHLSDFNFIAGQFVKWRFLQTGFWPEEHPFTISIEPNYNYLRLTPKAVGDYTGKIAKLKPGTPVLISNPLGAFTLKGIKNDKLLFIAGGIGITPIRAMLAELPDNCQADLVYIVKSPAETVFRTELDKLAKSRKFNIHYFYTESSDNNAGTGRLDGAKLKQRVPDIAKREIFICGPPAMMATVSAAAVAQGADKARIHSERFFF